MAVFLRMGCSGPCTSGRDLVLPGGLVRSGRAGPPGPGGEQAQAVGVVGADDGEVGERALRSAAGEDSVDLVGDLAVGGRGGGGRQDGGDLGTVLDVDASLVGDGAQRVLELDRVDGRTVDDEGRVVGRGERPAVGGEQGRVAEHLVGVGQDEEAARRRGPLTGDLGRDVPLVVGGHGGRRRGAVPDAGDGGRRPMLEVQYLAGPQPEHPLADAGGPHGVVVVVVPEEAEALVEPADAGDGLGPEEEAEPDGDVARLGTVADDRVELAPVGAPRHPHAVLTGDAGVGVGVEGGDVRRPPVGEDLGVVVEEDDPVLVAVEVVEADVAAAGHAPVLGQEDGSDAVVVETAEPVGGAVGRRVVDDDEPQRDRRVVEEAGDAALRVAERVVGEDDDAELRRRPEGPARTASRPQASGRSEAADQPVGSHLGEQVELATDRDGGVEEPADAGCAPPTDVFQTVPVGQLVGGQPAEGGGVVGGDGEQAVVGRQPVPQPAPVATDHRHAGREGLGRRGVEVLEPGGEDRGVGRREVAGDAVEVELLDEAHAIEPEPEVVHQRPEDGPPVRLAGWSGRRVPADEGDAGVDVPAGQLGHGMQNQLRSLVRLEAADEGELELVRPNVGAGGEAGAVEWRGEHGDRRQRAGPTGRLGGDELGGGDEDVGPAERQLLHVGGGGERRVAPAVAAVGMDDGPSGVELDGQHGAGPGLDGHRLGEVVRRPDRVEVDGRVEGLVEVGDGRRPQALLDLGVAGRRAGRHRQAVDRDAVLQDAAALPGPVERDDVDRDAVVDEAAGGHLRDPADPAVGRLRRVLAADDADAPDHAVLPAVMLASRRSRRCPRAGSTGRRCGTRPAAPAGPGSPR